MKVFVFTPEHLKDILTHVDTQAYDAARFMQALSKMGKTLVEYLFEILTCCVEEYEPLTLVKDYEGEYDAIFEVFGDLVQSVGDMRDIRAQDVRVVSLPFDDNHIERLSFIEVTLTNNHLLSQDDLDHFIDITERLVMRLEAHYLYPEREKTPKHLLFARYQSALCVFVH